MHLNLLAQVIHMEYYDQLSIFELNQLNKFSPSQEHLSPTMIDLIEL